MKKHILFLLTALTLLAALFPAAVSAADNGGDYALSSVGADGKSVNVNLWASGDCSLVVGLYDKSGRMTAARSANVSGQTNAQARTVTFDEEIGADLNAKAFLLDAETCAPLCLPEENFPADQYALIERIYLEDSFAFRVLSATLANVANQMTTVTPIDIAHSAPRAYLRFTSGAAREVSLNESEAYRLNDNQIWPDFFPGQIVRYSVTRDGDYRLRAVGAANSAAYSGDYSGNTYAVANQQLYGFVNSSTGWNIQADSNTKFIISDSGTYKSYTGVSKLPNVSAVSFGRAYCKDNLAKVVYLVSTNVEGTPGIIFLAAPSVSKRIDDDDYAPYFEYNAVAYDDITTVRVAYYVYAGYSGDRLVIDGVTTGSDKKSECILINEAKYDGDDVLKSGRFVTSTGARSIMSYQVQGINRVSGSLKDIKLDTANTEISKTFSDSVRVYFSDTNGEIEEIRVEDIRTDSNDWVYYVEESGEITYMFIQEAGDDDISP